MFNEADLLPLPVVPPTPGIGSSSGLYSLQKAAKDAANSSSAEGIAAASTQADARVGAAAPPSWRRGVVDDNAKRCHVVEACAMVGDNVALALADGRLCQGNLSRILEVDAKGANGNDPVDGEEARSGWSSWNSRHGKVLELHHSPAHDALMTLEVNTGGLIGYCCSLFFLTPYVSAAWASSACSTCTCPFERALGFCSEFFLQCSAIGKITFLITPESSKTQPSQGNESSM